MCLLTKKPEVKIASRNIVSYKKVRFFNKMILTSTTMGFKYKLGEVYVLGGGDTPLSLKPVSVFECLDDFSYADAVVEKKYELFEHNPFDLRSPENPAFKGLFVVSEGFHSYKTLERAKTTYRGYNIIYVKCIIPKGSEYVRDATGLIVSNSIIVTEIVV